MKPLVSVALRSGSSFLPVPHKSILDIWLFTIAQKTDQKKLSFLIPLKELHL